MGRTNPTFRDVLDRVRRRWRPFRRGLRRREQAAFDEVLAKAGAHADAAGYANPEEPVTLALLSVLVAQERERADLEARLDAAETRLAAVEEPAGRDRPGGAAGPAGADDAPVGQPGGAAGQARAAGQRDGTRGPAGAGEESARTGRKTGGTGEESRGPGEDDEALRDALDEFLY